MTPTTLADLENEDNVLEITNSYTAWKQIKEWFEEKNDERVGDEDMQCKFLFEEGGKEVRKYWLDGGSVLLYVIQ